MNKEPDTLFYTISMSPGFPVRYLWQSNCQGQWLLGPFADPGEASQEFQAAYGPATYVTPEEFRQLEAQ